MAGGNYEQANYRVTLGGVEVEEILDVSIPPPPGSETGFVMARGGRVNGHVFTRKANGIEAGIQVSYPTSDSERLEILAVTKDTVSFLVTCDNPSELPDNCIVGFTSDDCKVSRGGNHMFGDNPEAVAYTVRCRGYTMSFKNGVTITVDARGNVQIA